MKKFVDFLEDFGSQTGLKCAHCDHCETHVQGIAWYRRTEDAKLCNTAVVDHFKCSEIETDGVCNPSDRRDGMHIVFNCESCFEYSSLTLAQHKGLTFISVCKCPKELLEKSFSPNPYC